jgi:hypothetical protein
MDGGEWLFSEPSRFAHLIGGWVGPRAGVDFLEKTKFLVRTGIFRAENENICLRSAARLVPPTILQVSTNRKKEI